MISRNLILAYGIATAVIGGFAIIHSFVSSPDRLTGATDFPAFYNAGRIVNSGQSRHLYDRHLQMQMFAEVAPSMEPAKAPFFAYSPFFALLFSPLALLPYLPAFIIWALLSAGMLALGFRVVWKTAGLPDSYLPYGLIIAVTFLPFYAWCLFLGQTSAFAVLLLALAISLDAKRKCFLSGCCLATLLYKPPLLILLVPMLIVTRRYQTLVGFTFGSIVLGSVSLALLRVAGINDYLNTLVRFAQLKTGQSTTTLLEVDAFSFFLKLASGNIKWAAVCTVLLMLVVGPFLILNWVRHPQNAWVHAITWTLILNFYVLLYDVTLVILAVVLSIGCLVKSKAYRLLLLALILVPWVEVAAASHLNFQPMTVVLILFGCALIWRPMAQPSQSAKLFRSN